MSFPLNRRKKLKTALKRVGQVWPDFNFWLNYLFMKKTYWYYLADLWIVTYEKDLNWFLSSEWQVDWSHPVTMQPNTVFAKHVFVFFYGIFTKQLLYLLSYAREWTLFPSPTKQTSAGCCAGVNQTSLGCSGNDVTLRDNSTQAWEKLILENRSIF